MSRQLFAILSLCIMVVALSFSPQRFAKQSSKLMMAPPKFSLFPTTSKSASSKAAPASKPATVASKAASPAKGKAPAAAPAKKGSKAPAKDMTWGGRPDPTPEIVVVEKETGFFGAPWRFGKK